MDDFTGHDPGAPIILHQPNTPGPNPRWRLPSVTASLPSTNPDGTIGGYAAGDGSYGAQGVLDGTGSR